IMLASIVRSGPAAIADVGARLARGQVVLDCTGVDVLLPEQLEFLLAAIPAHWDFVELGECIDPAMVSPQLAEQLAAWLDRRHGRARAGLESRGQESAVSDRTAEPRPPTPDPRSPDPYPAAALRDRLEHLVIADLLGPVGGPEEIVDERSVRGRY